MLDLPGLLTCDRCSLHKTRTQVVTGCGSTSSPVVLVGEGPGYNEDISGFPFVGLSGNLLVDLLRKAGISRDQIYLTNTVKCRSWVPNPDKPLVCDNAPPLPSQAGECRHWLDQEIALLKPKIIVCIGAEAARTVLGRRVTMARDSNRWHEKSIFDGVLVRLVYHPAFILRQNGEEQRRLSDILVSEFITVLAKARELA